MRWPWQASENDTRITPSSPGPLNDVLTPTNLLTAAALTTIFLTSARLYRTRLRRIPTAGHVPASRFHEDIQSFPRRHTVLGVVVRISDGDGIRIYHTPGGWLAGWRWLRQIPTGVRKRASSNNSGSKNEGSGGSWMSENTINVRFSGIDAPELAHFGHPAQPGAEEATECLKRLAMGRWARIYPHSRDQYGRLVGTVFVNKWHLGGALLLRRWVDAGAEVVREGWATVYEGKVGAKFGGEKRGEMLSELENHAKEKRLGVWSGGGHVKKGGRKTKEENVSALTRLWMWLRGTKEEEQSFESPREFKARMKKVDEEEKGKK